MALTQLNTLLSFDEWKEQSPVNHRGMGVPLDNDVNLRLAYNAYVKNTHAARVADGDWEPLSFADEEYLGQKQYEFVAKNPDITSPEDYTKALNKSYEVPYDEKLGRLFAGDNYTSLIQDYAHPLRHQLDEMGFDPVEYKRVYDKQDPLSTPEQSTLDTFTPLVENYVGGAWPIYARQALARGEVGIIQEEREDGSITLTAHDGIPAGGYEHAVHSSIMQGLLGAQHKKAALKFLQAKDKRTGLPAVKMLNFENAVRDIGVLVGNNESFAKEMDAMIKIVADVSKLQLSPEPHVPEFEDTLSEDDPRLLHHGIATGDPSGRTILPYTKYVTGLSGDPALGGMVIPPYVGDPVTKTRYSQDYGKLLDIFDKVFSTRQHYSDEVKLKALQYVATTGAYGGGAAKFWFDKDGEEQQVSNVVTAGYGHNVLHGNLFLSGKDFNNLLESPPEGYSKDYLMQSRDKYFIDNADHIANILNDSDMRKEWVAYSTGPASRNPDNSNKKFYKIVQDFLDADEGVTGKLWRRRMRRELEYAGGDLVGLAAVVMGSVFSEDLRHLGSYMLETSAEERETAVRAKELYGEKFSFGTNAMAMALPLAVDLTATGLLSVASGGPLGAAYGGAALSKYGFKTTAKGYVNSVFGGSMRRMLTQAAKDQTLDTSLQQLYLRGYIKTLHSAKTLKEADLAVMLGRGPFGRTPRTMFHTDGSPLVSVKGSVLPPKYYGAVARHGDDAKTARELRKGTPPQAVLPKELRSKAAMDALDAIAAGHATRLSKTVRGAAMFAPAFSRSASSAYGNIYHLLRDATGPDGTPLTEEERHERAFMGGAVSGTITGALVLGLHGMGLGGLETYAAGRATVGHVRRVFESLRNKPYLGFRPFVRDVVDKVVRKGFAELKSPFRHLKGPVATSTFGETGQEGLDAFLNSFTRSWQLAGTSANEDNLPFIKRVHEGLWGAAYGAVLGGVTGVGIKGVSAFQGRGGRGEEEARFTVARRFEKEIRKTLEESGSPETAQTLEEILIAMRMAELSPPKTALPKKDAAPESEAVTPETPTVEPETEEDAELGALQDELQGLMDIKSDDLTDEQTKRIEEINALLVGERTEAEGDFVEEALKLMGFTVADIAEHLDVIRNPSKASAVQKSNALGALKLLLDSALPTTDTEVLTRRANGYEALVYQIRTNKTEEDADAALDAASPEARWKALLDVFQAASDKAALEESSGTGESVVTPDEKQEMADQFARLARGKGWSEEAALNFAAKEVRMIMDTIRVSPEIAESLATLVEQEVELAEELRILEQTFADLTRIAQQKRAYGKVSKANKYIKGAAEPTVELIAQLKEDIVKLSNVKTKTDSEARQQEITALGNLLIYLEQKQKLNEKRAELTEDTDEDRGDEPLPPPPPPPKPPKPKPPKSEAKKKAVEEVEAFALEVAREAQKGGHLGVCYECSMKVVERYPDWKIVKGHHARGNMVHHAWLEGPEGDIIDPTANQFASEGGETLKAGLITDPARLAEYRPFTPIESFALQRFNAFNMPVDPFDLSYEAEFVAGKHDEEDDISPVEEYIGLLSEDADMWEHMEGPALHAKLTEELEAFRTTELGLKPKEGAPDTPTVEGVHPDTAAGKIIYYSDEENKKLHPFPAVFYDMLYNKWEKEGRLLSTQEFGEKKIWDPVDNAEDLESSMTDPIFDGWEVTDGTEFRKSQKDHSDDYLSVVALFGEELGPDFPAHERNRTNPRTGQGLGKEVFLQLYKDWVDGKPLPVTGKPPKPPTPRFPPEVQAFIENRILSGAHARGQATKTGIRGIPSEFKLNGANSQVVANTIDAGIQDIYQSLALTAEGRPVTSKLLIDAFGIGPAQAATIKTERSDKIGLGLKNNPNVPIFSIMDTVGGIFDTESRPATNERVILFNNDPRSMRHVFSKLPYTDIPIPNTLPSGVAINPAFRNADGRKQASKADPVEAIFYPSGELTQDSDSGSWTAASRTRVTDNKTEDDDTPLGDVAIDTEQGHKVNILWEFLNAALKINVRYTPRQGSTDQPAGILEEITNVDFREESMQQVEDDLMEVITSDPDAVIPVLDSLVSQHEALTGVAGLARGGTGKADLMQTMVSSLIIDARRQIVETAIIQRVQQAQESGESLESVFKDLIKSEVALDLNEEGKAVLEKALLAAKQNGINPTINEAGAFIGDANTLAFVFSQFLFTQNHANKRARKEAGDPDAVQFVFTKAAEKIPVLARNRVAETKKGEPTTVPNFYPTREAIIAREKKRVQKLRQDADRANTVGQESLLENEEDETTIAQEEAIAEAKRRRRTKKSTTGNKPSEVKLSKDSVTKWTEEVKAALRAVITPPAATSDEGSELYSPEAADAIFSFYSTVFGGKGREGLIEKSSDPYSLAVNIASWFLKTPKIKGGQVELDSFIVDIAKARRDLARDFGAATAGNELGLAAFMALQVTGLVKPLSADELGDLQNVYGGTGLVGGLATHESASVISKLVEEGIKNAPSYADAKLASAVRKLNRQDIADLGLVDGDIESVIKAIRMIADGDYSVGTKRADRLNTFVANLLLQNEDVLRGLDFSIIEGELERAGFYSSGRITLNLNGRYGKGVSSTLLHESFHALYDKLSNTPDADLTPAQRAARKQMQIVFGRAKAQWAKAKKRGISDPLVDKVMDSNTEEEFFTTLLTSSDFQSSMKALADGTRSVFRRAIDAIVNFLTGRNRVDKEMKDALKSFLEFANFREAGPAKRVYDSVLKDIAERVGEELEARNSLKGGYDKIVAELNRVSREQEESLIDALDGTEGVFVTPDKQRTVNRMIDRVVADSVPSNVRVVYYDTQEEAEAGAFKDAPNKAFAQGTVKQETGTGTTIQDSAIFINRSKVLAVVAEQLDSSIQDRHVFNIIGKNIIHEVEHLAEDQAVLDSERDAIAEEMGTVGLEQTADRYLRNSPEEAEALKEELRSEDPEVSVPARRKTVSERLRMERELRTTGLTTEDVLTYDPTAPILMRVLKVSLTRFLRKLLVNLDTGRSNPELRASAYHVSERLRFLYAEDVTLHPIPFDPADPTRGLEHIARVFSSTTPVTSSTTDAELQEQLEMRERLASAIEYPVGRVANGKFEGVATGKGWHPANWVKMWKRAGQDPRIDDVQRYEERMIQSLKSLAESDLLMLEVLTKKAFGSSPEIDVLIALNKAGGTTDSLDLTVETKKAITKNWVAAARKVKKEVQQGKRSIKDISETAKISLKNKMVGDVIRRRRAQLIEQARQDQRDAEKFLEDTARTPEAGKELVNHIFKVRFTLDELSKRSSKELGLSSVYSKLAMKFTERLGIHLTRAFRVFDDVAYLDELLKPDGKLQGRRDAAMPYFEEEQIKVWRKVFRRRIDAEQDPDTGEGFIEASPEALAAKAKSEQSPAAKNAEAQLLAEQYIKDHPELATAAMDYLLKSYHPEHKEGHVDVVGKVGPRSASLSSWARGAIDNLRPKANLDAGLRFFMGQYGLLEKDGEFVEAGVHSMFHTMQRLTTLATSQAFYNNLRTIGGAKEFNEDGTVADNDTGFVLTWKEVQEKNIDLAAEDYVHVKTGERLTSLMKPEDIEAPGFTGLFDPTADLFVPERLYKAHRYFKNFGVGNALTDARKLPFWNPIFDTAMKIYLRANMIALGTKTLANFPAYHGRNMITAAGFYALAAGGPKVAGMAMVEMFRAARRAKLGLTDPKIKEEQDILHQRLGIDLSSTAVGIITQHDNYTKRVKTKKWWGQSADETEETQALIDANTLMSSLLSGDVREEQAALKKSGSLVWRGTKGLVKGGWGRLIHIAQGIDAATKIAIYNEELRIMKNARTYEKENNVDLGYRDMTDTVMEEKAAEKARGLAPTYSEAGVAVRQLRKYSAFVGEPYFAFFADQFRIVHNNIVTIPNEEGASENPIIRARGNWRRGWGMFVYAMTPLISLTAKSFLGIDATDDEDEFLIEGAPDWGKRNQYIYIDGDRLADMDPSGMSEMFRGKMVAVDLTYINSSSPVSDPQTASIKALLRGKPEDIPKHLWEGYGKRFTENPLLIGGVVEATKAASKNEMDSLLDRIVTFLGTLFEEGFQPGWLRKIRKHHDDKEDLDTPEEEAFAKQRLLLGMTSPIQARAVDFKESLLSITYRHSGDRNKLKRETSKWIQQAEEYTVEELNDYTRKAAQKFYDMDKQMSKMITAATDIKHGLTSDQVLPILVDGGISKSRARNFIGIDDRGRPDGVPKSERYLVPKNITDAMTAAGGWRAQRVEILKGLTHRYGGRQRFTKIELTKETPDN